MTQINLLPWREQSRQIKKIQFVTALIVAIGFTLFILAILHLYFDIAINHQQHRNRYLQSIIQLEEEDLAILKKKKIAKKSIEAQLQFIIDLRLKSYRAVRILNELPTMVPNSLALNTIKREGNTITIIGHADSNLPITYFMKNIAKSPYFTQPVLTEITAAAGNIPSDKIFQLNIEQKD